MADDRDLLDNHHAFTARHRGDVVRLAGAVRWDSPSAYFRCVLLDSAEGLSAVTGETAAVRTFPWSAHLAPTLERLGFQRGAELRTMRSDPQGSDVGVPAHVTIEQVTDEAGMARFSDVQTRGFADPGEELEPLYTFLHAANLRNLGEADQRFYVGWADGAPVAVTLLLVYGSTAGIYAVATLPEHRRRGYSRALLTRATCDARDLGCEVVTLQVFLGSDAERVYTSLGFTVAFDCQLWARS
jgi:GNAT superfamily N-acetyltransferase